MALNTIDERDLLLPLFEKLGEAPLWDTFLKRLLARTRAQRLHLFIRPGGPGAMPPIRRTIDAPGHPPAPAEFDLESFSAAGLLPFASLRRNRVYSLEETTAPGGPDEAKRQRGLLEATSVAHARCIRITARGDHDAWIVLLHDRRDFGASDSALLSALAPHFAIALALLMDLHGLRLRAQIAEDALALIGVGQALFDADGQLVAADAVATREFEVQGSGRAPLRPVEAQALAMVCRELARAPASARRTVRFDDRNDRHMLLRRAPITPESPSGSGHTVGLVRTSRREDTRSAASVIEATLGLSQREAALAEAISMGRSIVDAGAELQLTAETARNYSKRIYAKTGASGQADLVRMLLTGLSPFA